MRTSSVKAAFLLIIALSVLTFETRGQARLPDARGCVSWLRAQVDAISAKHRRWFWSKMYPGKLMPEEWNAIAQRADQADTQFWTDFNSMPDDSTKVDYMIDRLRFIGPKLHWDTIRTSINESRVREHIHIRNQLSRLCLKLYFMNLGYQSQEQPRGIQRITDAQAIEISDLLSGYCTLMDIDFWSKYDS